MALDLDGSTQYGLTASTPLTGAPFTMYCAFNAYSLTGAHVLMGLFDSGGDNDFYQLMLAGATGGDPLRFRSKDGGSNSDADSTVPYSTGTWQTAIAVASDAATRVVYLNGGSSGSSSAISTPGSIDRIGIGATCSATIANWAQAIVAFPTFWDIALDAGQIAALAAWKCPLLVARANIVPYYPFIPGAELADDRVGSYDLTLYGSPSSVADPAVTFPPRWYWQRQRTVRRAG